MHAFIGVNVVTLPVDRHVLAGLIDRGVDAGLRNASSTTDDRAAFGASKQHAAVRQEQRITYGVYRRADRLFFKCYRCLHGCFLADIGVHICLTNLLLSSCDKSLSRKKLKIRIQAICPIAHYKWHARIVRVTRAGKTRIDAVNSGIKTAT